MEIVIGAVAFWYLFLRGKPAPAIRAPAAQPATSPATTPPYGTPAWFAAQGGQVSPTFPNAGVQLVETRPPIIRFPPQTTIQPPPFTGGVPPLEGSVGDILGRL